MIDMQYNFPLLPELPAQWKDRLGRAVEGLGIEDFGALRPTFRSERTAQVEVAARWLGLPPERTLLTEGAHHGSLLSMMAAGLAGQVIAVDAVAYTGGLEQARMLGAAVVGCAVDAEGTVPESLRQRCVEGAAAGRPVAALFCTPTVHNPLGSVASAERRAALIAVARAFDLLVIEDDTYGFMAPEAGPRLVELAPERTFYVSALSKSYAPATRTGFLVVPERFVAAAQGAIKTCATGTSLVHNAAALSLVADGSVDAVIGRKLAEGTARNAAARAMLPTDSCWPGAAAAWHLWVGLPAGVTPESFERRMAERGVGVSGGNWFAVGPEAPNGFRVALGGEVSRERVLEGVQMVAEELARL